MSRLRDAIDAGAPTARALYREYEAAFGAAADAADIESRLRSLPFAPGDELLVTEKNVPPHERATDVEPPGTRSRRDRVPPISYSAWRAEPLAGGVLVPTDGGFTVHQFERPQATIALDTARATATLEYTYQLPQLWWDRVLRVIPKPDGALLYTARQLRRDLGAVAPSATEFMRPVRLFGGEFCVVGDVAYRRGRTWVRKGPYQWNSTTWTDRLLSATWTHPDQLRVRVVPGTHDERFAAWAVDGRRGIIEMGEINLATFSGQPNGRLALLAGRDASALPFEIVPSPEGGFALFVVTEDRVPRLLRPNIDGVVEIASGPAVRDGLVLGNLAWIDLNGDDELEYIALALDEQTKRRRLVVLVTGR